MLSSEAAGVRSSQQRRYMERSAGGGNGWNHFDVGFVDNGCIPAARTRSYTIGSSLDPTIDALKAAVEQAAPYIASRNPFTSSSATTNPSIATNSSSVPQFDRRFPQRYGTSEPQQDEEYDYNGLGGNSLFGAAQNSVPLLLSLVAEHRDILREFAVDIEKAAAGAPLTSGSDFRGVQSKHEQGEGPFSSDAPAREALYARLARCCASWLEALSHQAFSQPSAANGGLSQIDKLAASIPPVCADEAISSLLKTAILQSLLLTRIASDKCQHQRSPSRSTLTYASAASLIPAPNHLLPHAAATTSFATNAALVQALRESPSDSTLSGLLQEVDLQRIAAKFSSYTNFAHSFPADVGALIRANGDDSVLHDTTTTTGGRGAQEVRHRSYSDIQQYESQLPRSTADLKMNTTATNVIKRVSGGRNGGEAVEDDQAEGIFDTSTRKKKNAQQRSASPSTAVSPDGPSTLSSSEGVHVPQLDLDAILMPSAPSTSGVIASSISLTGDVSDWQQRVRQAVRKGTASLLTNNSRQRLRSQSDLVSKATSEQDPPVSEDLDLRPTWMRKPKLFKAIKSKLEAMVQQKPVFYVEWNILGFLKVLSDPTQDRIVSPEYAVSIGPDVQLSPLRLMVSICHGEAEPQAGGVNGLDYRKCQIGKVKIGVEFTIPADIEVRYHVFHGSFFSEARWHSFKEKPWAGVNALEVNDYLPHPIDQNLTVGVILLEIKGNGLATHREGRNAAPISCHTQQDMEQRPEQRGSKASNENSGLNPSGSPGRSINPSTSSRQVSWVQSQAPVLGTMLPKGSRASLNSAGYSSNTGGRPRAYSDWHSSSQSTASQQLRSQLTPPTRSPGPIALPSVSDLLRLSGAPQQLLPQTQGSDICCGRNGTIPPSETPSLMLHESLSRMSLNPTDHFDKQLFTEIWSSTSSPSTYDDLVFGCLR